MRTIKGKYYEDGNGFTCVITDNGDYYTIASNGNWGCIRHGGTFANGVKVPEAWLNEERSKCSNYGTFVLRD